MRRESWPLEPSGPDRVASKAKWHFDVGLVVQASCGGEQRKKKENWKIWRRMTR